MRLQIEGSLKSESDLPRHLRRGRHSTDVGRTWFVDEVWHIWTSLGWQRAIATRTAPASVIK